MPDTLLKIVRDHFHVAVDPDSDGGQILNLLVPTASFSPTGGALKGDATADSLTFALTPTGVSVRAAQDTDAIAFRYPLGTFKFTILPATESFPLRVEIALIAMDLPVPFLHPAQETSPDSLKPIPGKVELALPPLLLVVNASVTTPAGAHLSPFQGGVPEIPVTLKPEFASVDEDCVVGFHLQTAKIKLGSAPEVLVTKLKLYIAPPGLAALAMTGSAENLHIGLGAGTGVTGDFKLTLADGEGAASRPRFLKKMAAHLQLQDSAVTLLELSGQIGVSEELEKHFSGFGDSTAETIKYTALLRLDPTWETSLALSGVGENNYLWRKTRQNASAAVGSVLNTLGAFAVLAPVLKPVTTAAVGSLAGSTFFKTESITLVGGEIQFVRNAAGVHEGRLLFEIETELTVEISELKLKSSRPLKVRHKALGVKLDFGANGSAPRLEPVIDDAQGFALDLSDPGLFNMQELGDLLKPDGARIAKENPLFIEIDLVSKANLGVVSIDRASVRVPIVPLGKPSLTALGAHLDAGPVTGGGYLKILDNGFDGRLDVSLGMLGVRASAGLKLLNEPGFVALGATLEVEWPVPIPLATSGIGLYGLLGLFAMHLKRQLNAGEKTLDWFRRAGGDPSKFSMWGPNEGRWAFGAGAVLGTLEGGYIIHAKGMLMIELPGPSILIVMNADILSARPGTRGTELGAILALIEITPHSLTLAIVLDYRELKPLLQVRLPVEAFFNFDDSEDWHLDVGGIPPEKRVLVKFLDTFRADGYFLIHGNGIEDFKPPLYGFAIAVGVHVAFTWGPKAIGLYMTVVFEGDLGIGFKPFLLAGKAGISGELHLFILSLGISASAKVLIAKGGWQVIAEVCARVEFLFFDVEGCVTLKLGDPPPLPDADPLVSALSLHARPPALLVGSGATEQPVDGSMGNAFHFDKEQNQFIGDPGQAAMPKVPIDAIPVLQLEMRPGADPACKFFQSPIQGLIASEPTSQPLTVQGIPRPGWLKRSNRFFHYRLQSVELTRLQPNGTPFAQALTAGHPAGNLTPVTWWDSRGTPSPGVDNQVQLALLTWQVDPTPAAAERTSSRDEILKRRWGNVCQTVVESAHILWTFRDVSVGRSANGWTLSGIAHRDPADIARAGPMDVTLRVSEPWRSPDPLANSLVRVESAYVFGSASNDGHILMAPHTGLEPQPCQPGNAALMELMTLHPLPSLEGLANALRFNTKGMTWVRILFFGDAERYSNSEFLLRMRDEQNQILAELKIDASNSKRVTSKQELLALWGGFGPWLPLVDSVWTAWEDNTAAFVDGTELVLFESTLDAVPFQIEIGMIVDGRVDADGVVQEKWGVLALEAETAAERARIDFDNKHRDDELTAVDGALHADDGKRALLMPGSLYEVKVVYQVAKAPADEYDNPKLNVPEAEVEELHTQRFRFETDSRAPARLDPWVMATDPAPAQNFFFFQDPLHIVFATNATRKLFAAYGQQLFAVAKAASGNHPDPLKIPSAETLPAGSAVSLTSLPAIVLLPFNSRVRELLANETCRNFSTESDTHELVTLDVPLEPLTDYILDMEPHTLSGNPIPSVDPLTPLYRLHFTTSRYATFNALAQAVAKAAKEQRVDRWLPNHAALDVLAVPGQNKERAVTDHEFEGALRRVQWGDMSRPSAPRVTVIWSGNPAAPTPYGVLIETPEPLWRRRGVPEIKTEPPDDPNGIKRYRLVPELWLAIPDPGVLVSCFLHSTAGDRTLVVLGANARGSTLHLNLRRSHHRLYEDKPSPNPEPLLQVALHAAPWEEIA